MTIARARARRLATLLFAGLTIALLAAKAHIGWDGWKDAEIYTYEAYVFSENELE